MNKNRLLFVVGVGRSGTSLLQSMLAAHPAVAYMPETAFLRRYVASGSLTRLFRNQGIGSVIEKLTSDDAFRRTGMDVADLVEKAAKSAQPIDVAIFAILIENFCAGGQTWVGDKDPRMIEFLPLLAKICEDSSVIHIIRDPRDVLASKKKAAWSSRGHVWKHVFANRVQFLLGHRTGPRQFSENYHEIIYEELISSPRNVLTALAQRIGLPFDERMLSFAGAARKLVSSSELSWKKETLGPLLKDNKGKWKSLLDPKEILLTEACCREAIKVGGYHYDDRVHPLSLVDMLWVMAGVFVIRLGTWPYIAYRKFKVVKACKRLEV